MDGLSDILLELYRLAHYCRRDDFQARTMDLLQAQAINRVATLADASPARMRRVGLSLRLTAPTRKLPEPWQLRRQLLATTYKGCKASWA